MRSGHAGVAPDIQERTRAEDTVRWFFDQIRSVIREELMAQGQCDEWIQQRGSALGNRKHCAAVRRRLENGEDGAAIRGKRFLLTTRALSEELRRGGPPPLDLPLAKTAPIPDSDGDEAYTEIISIARGGRR